MTTYLNARFLTQPVSGVQRYALELISALDTAWDPARDGRLVAFYPSNTPLVLHPNWRNVEIAALPGGVGHLWEQSALYAATRLAPLVSLCNAGPLRHPAQAVVFHDAHVFDFPEAFTAPYRLLHNALRPRLARRAARCITVSPYSADRLAEHTGVERWDIVPNAADHVFRVMPDCSILQELELHKAGFFLCTANRGPIKNADRLIAAHAALGISAPPLVMVGGDLAVLGKTGAWAGSNVIPAGRVSDAALRALYEAASAVIAPARSEGFGIPALEAAALGVPVLASRAGAQPWVMGDAAMWFDPDTVEDMSRCLRAFLDLGENGRACMIENGRARAQAFRWSDSAQALYDVIWALHGQPAKAA